MMMVRRRFLRLAVSVAVMPVASGPISAQGYPARPVRIIAPVPPAASAIISVRLTHQRLLDRCVQSFVIENRPGAATNIGTDPAVRSPPDGYTLLSMTANNATNATIYENLRFD